MKCRITFGRRDLLLRYDRTFTREMVAYPLAVTRVGERVDGRRYPWLVPRGHPSQSMRRRSSEASRDGMVDLDRLPTQGGCSYDRPGSERRGIRPRILPRPRRAVGILDRPISRARVYCLKFLGTPLSRNRRRSMRPVPSHLKIRSCRNCRLQA
jgi:hypothetical protein